MTMYGVRGRRPGRPERQGIDAFGPQARIVHGWPMDITAFLKSLEESGLANRIRDSLWLFPLIESTHVIGLALVFGTIAIIDLRLLGIASTQRSFKRMASDILKWTWAAFALTAFTGMLMFITNASVYFHNFFFRTKMLLLVLTGINMLVFELTAGRTLHHW